MKAGPKAYLFLGIGGFFVFLTRLLDLLGGQGEILDVVAAIFFLLLCADGFVSYLRLKGKTKFHLIS